MTRQMIIKTQDLSLVHQEEFHIIKLLQINLCSNPSN